MPTNTWQNISPSIELIRKWMPRSVLDVGCGFGRWGLLCREFLDVWEGHYDPQDWQVKIDGIESDARIIGPGQKCIYDDIHIGSISSILPTLGFYDLIVLDGVLEHVEKDEALRLLTECVRHRSDGGRILIHVPIEPAHEGGAPSTSRSRWTLTDFDALGPTSSAIDQGDHGRTFATIVFGGNRRSLEPGNARSSPLRIALPCQEYPTEHNATVGGGIGTYVRNLARWLAHRGHDVHVLLSHRSGADQKFEEAGVQIHNMDLPAPNMKNPECVKAYSRAVADRLREIERHEPFDIVHFSDWGGEGWAYRPGPNTVVSVKLLTPSHLIRDFEYNEGTPEEHRVSDLERWAPERADLVLSPSMLITRQIAESWSIEPKEVIHSPLPLDLPAYDKIIEGTTDAGVDPDLVVCVNRLTPLKGPDVLIGAATRVLAHHPNTRFRFVGRGAAWGDRSAEAHLLDLAQSRGIPDGHIEFAGARSREDMPAELRRAAVCVNPSRIESYSYTSAEALASGRPLILTDAQGISEYLTSGENCMIIKKDGEDELAQAICALLDNPEEARKMGNAGRSVMERVLSTDPVLGPIESAFLDARNDIRSRKSVTPTRLNIAVFSHNALDHTRKCIRAIQEHTNTPFNLFIVDNASTDKTPDWLQTIKGPSVHVDLSRESLGIPGVRNRLLQTIFPWLPEDGYVVFLDQNTEVTEGWTTPFLDAFDAHSKAAIAGSDGNALVVTENTLELLPPPDDRVRVDVASGAAFWIKAEAAWQIGFFDEKIGPIAHVPDYCVRGAAFGHDVLRVSTDCLVQPSDQPDAALTSESPRSSIANRDAAMKWLRHGWIDSSGRVRRLHRIIDLTPEVRARIANEQGRTERQLPEAELLEAGEALENLLNTPDLAEEFVGPQRQPLSPTLLILLNISLEATRSSKDNELTHRLERVHEVLSQNCYERTLSPHLSRAPAGDRPRGTVRLNKLCDSNDWNNPDWMETAEAMLRAGDGNNYYRRHRQTWEYTQLAYGLHQLGVLHDRSHGLSVGAGREQLMFALSTKVAHLTAVDLYDARARQDFDIPEDIVEHPEKYAGVPFKKDRLTLCRMNALALELPHETFDFVYSAAALQHFGGQPSALRALSEMARVVKPGGIVALSTDFILNRASDGHRFRPDELVSKLLEPTGLRLIEQMDLSLSDGTLEGFGDCPANYGRTPHFLLHVGPCLLGSGTIFLEREPARREGASPRYPGAFGATI